MGHVISPLQPFKVRRQAQLSFLQMQSLTQLYQPIMGGKALSLYFTLMSMPMVDHLWSQQFLHSQLLETLNVGTSTIQEARLRLEGLGLIRTYRQKNSHANAQLQILVYDLQLPQDAHDFFHHPQLSTALYRAIGDQEYSLRMKEWQVEKLDEEHFVEISADFQTIYNYLTMDQSSESHWQEEDTFLKHQQGQDNFALTANDFDYGKFLTYILGETINHNEINQALKAYVLSCHQMYGLSEVEMSEVVKLCRHPLRGNIQLDRFNEIAAMQAQRKKQYRKDKMQNEQRLTNQSSEIKRDGVATKTTEHTTPKVQATVHPELSPSENELIQLSESLDNEQFLFILKKQLGGFATDSESFYVRQLKEKSELATSTINILIYYLLIILKRENIFKGELEKTANVWQQKKFKDAAQALIYARTEHKVQRMADQKRQRSGGNYYKKAPGHTEMVPEWMRDDCNESDHKKTETADPSAQLDLDESTVRQQLKQLFGKKDA